MLNIQLDPTMESSSELDRTRNILRRLGSYLPLDAFLNTPYEGAKIHLDTLAKAEMERKWASVQIHGTYCQKRHWGLKPKWGPEECILNAPADRVAAYLEFKTNTQNGATKENGCILCHNPLASTHHLLFGCHSLSELRNTFIERLKNDAPLAHKKLTTELYDNHRLASDFIFGTAKSICTIPQWESLQVHTIDYSFNLKMAIQEKKPSLRLTNPH